MPLADITNEIDLYHSLTIGPAIVDTASTVRQARATGTKRTRVNSGRETGLSGLGANGFRRAPMAFENANSSDESLLGDVPEIAPASATEVAHRAVRVPSSTTASLTVSQSSEFGNRLKKDNQASTGSLTSHRQPWTTFQVPPKTHKTTSGQLIILPSHSTLIDFREGERRKGKKGDEVILVSVDGLTVRMFSGFVTARV
jgi:hypothetical protein